MISFSQNNNQIIKINSMSKPTIFFSTMLVTSLVGITATSMAAPVNLDANAWTVDGSATNLPSKNAGPSSNLTNTTNAAVPSITISGTGYVRNTGGLGTDDAINAGSGSIGAITITGSGNGNVAISATGGSAIYDASLNDNTGMTITNSGATASTITASNDWTVWFQRTTGTGNFTYTQGNTAGTEAGNITNTGTNNVFAVNVQTSDVTFNNYNGTMSSSGLMTAGNFGVIGVSTVNAGGNISVVNGSTGGTGTIELTNSNSTSSALYLRATNNGTISLTNTKGTISSYASSASGKGTVQIHQDNTGTGNVTINNSGTISNLRSTTAGSAIYFDDNGGTISITNNSGGSIITAGTGAAAIDNNGVHTGAITNSGVITGAGTTGEGGTAVAIDNSVNTTQITINLESGSSTNGAIKIGTGAVSEDIVNMKGGTLNGDIIAGAVNKGTVNVSANTSSNGLIGGANGLNVFNITSGTFTLNNNVKASTTTISIGAEVNIAATGKNITGSLVNNGTLTVEQGKTFTVSNNYSQSTNGTFKVGVSDDTTYGKLVVTGTATLPSNAKIDVNVTDTSFKFPTASNSGLADIISAGTLTSDGTFTVTDNSLLFNFTAVKDGNTVDLTLSSATPAVLTSTTNQGKTAASGAATVLDNVITNNPSGALATSFISLTDEQEVANAVESTLPAVSGGVAQLTNINNNAVTGIVSSRQSLTRGLSAGDGFMTNQYMWIKPFGGWTEQDNRQGVSGYDIENYGIAAGVDADVSSSWNVGFAAAFINSDVSSNQTTGANAVEVDSYLLKAYGTNMLDDVTALNLQLGWGISDYDSMRSIFTGAVADAEYSAWHIQASAELERSYSFNAKAVLTPYVHAKYSYVDVDSYIETGAGALNLNVDSDSDDSLVIGGGVKGSYSVSGDLLLVANMGLGYDVLTDRSSLTAGYAGGGAKFTTSGIEPDEWVYNAGAGVEYTHENGTEITARYDYMARDDYDDQSISVNFRIFF